MNDPALPALVTGHRLAALRERLIGLGLDSVLVSNPADIRYLTGFSGSAGLLVVAAGRAMLATDGRYRSQAAEQLAGAGVDAAVELVVDTVAGQHAALVKVLGAGEVALQAEAVTWSEARQWSELLGREPAPLEGMLTEMRSIKDDAEVARIEAAAAVADGALADCRSLLGTGLTERAFARALDHRMLTSGADGLSFETICASGPNAALPHARPTDRRIEPGDLVIVDFGAAIEGYRSDMTRTFHIGEPGEDAAEMLRVVTEAQRNGVAAVAAGVTCATVDRACRRVIDQAGMGEEFVHGTGHGVGLVIHEAPWVNGSSTTVLAPGHVVTVEPGVYRPSFGGARVEDTVLVTAEGSRPLTHAPKDPLVGIQG